MIGPAPENASEAVETDTPARSATRASVGRAEPDMVPLVICGPPSGPARGAKTPLDGGASVLGHF
ncbi:hypothetical protein Slu03_11210 [Sediminihabitans luteus]|nr:hypothetical protein Slu03_11210 [Sediminihabitans luteus]